MTIKEKDASLVRIGGNNNSLEDFLRDIFYKDKNGRLVKAALIFLYKISESGSLGLRAKNWHFYIMDMFNVEPLEKEEEELIRSLFERYKEHLNRKKPAQKLLSLFNNKKIELSDYELEVLKKFSVWNSSISSYYSVVNKLKAIGLIEKREGNYYLSEKLKNKMKKIIALLDSLK